MIQNTHHRLELSGTCFIWRSVLIMLLLHGVSASQERYGVAVMGTDRFTAEDIRSNHTATLEDLLTSRNTDRDRHRRECDAFAELLNSDSAFSYVNVNLFQSYAGNSTFILDFVEPEDAAQRLSFRKMSTRQFDDPDSLIEKWNAYEALSQNLFRQGEIRDMTCPVYHCTWAFDHPLLAPYLDWFTRYVPRHQEQLFAILDSSDAAGFRAAASFLLAHADIDPNTLVTRLSPAVRDPDSRVRNNSMRVIYYIVRNHDNIDLDLGLVADALGYPSFTDRNKALVILRSLKSYDLSQTDRGRVLDTLMEILEKKDGHNYRNAHLVLTRISGRDYEMSDIASWRAWVSTQTGK